ncbi:hypothetical protein SEA_BANTAM_115 [Gordonia phage Bantam]|uniref:Uncharacterized protein n=1 Tax=Gordonia phage Bantam TaxID=1887641 RepID=A0A1B3AYK1_9CAUD|nr:hypothetical protein BIZ77_gp064 [Gordonia phage Bantam]AOE43804.1 hypothetical protein SEA_BANTAM_115 [Gordonia phage Bantam]
MTETDKDFRSLIDDVREMNDPIDREIRIADFTAEHLIEKRVDRNLDMSRIAARMAEDGEEIRRLCEMLYGLGVDPYAHA